MYVSFPNGLVKSSNFTDNTTHTHTLLPGANFLPFPSNLDVAPSALRLRSLLPRRRADLRSLSPLLLSTRLRRFCPLGSCVFVSSTDSCFASRSSLTWTPFPLSSLSLIELGLCRTHRMSTQTFVLTTRWGRRVAGISVDWPRRRATGSYGYPG